MINISAWLVCFALNTWAGGDEDNGQTSAWYLFSAMEFYPVTTATNQYVPGAPFFKKITIRQQNGKTIILNAPQNSDANRYVSNVLFNGKPYTKNGLAIKPLLMVLL